MASDSDLDRYRREQELLFEELEALEVVDQADAQADALVQKLVDFYFSSRWCPPGLSYGRSEMEDADAVYNDAYSPFSDPEAGTFPNNSLRASARALNGKSSGGNPARSDLLVPE